MAIRENNYKQIVYIIYHIPALCDNYFIPFHCKYFINSTYFLKYSILKNCYILVHIVQECHMAVCGNEYILAESNDHFMVAQFII